MYDIIYSINGVNYQINADDDTHKIFESDPLYLQNYIENHLKPSTGSYEAIQEEAEERGTDFSWNKCSTLLLLESYMGLKEDFRDPKMKKRSLWNKIKEIFENKGYTVTEDILDRKFRNLKKTFTNIKDSKGKTGRGRISWEYYDQFEEIFSADKTINIPIVLSAGTVSQEPNDQIASTMLSSLVTTPLSTSKSESSGNCGKSLASTKMSSLFRCRKRQLDMEEKRVEELKLLRLTMERQNQIQEERNVILKEMLLRKENL